MANNKKPTWMVKMLQKVRRHTRIRGTVKVKSYYRNIGGNKWLNIKTAIIGGLIIVIGTAIYLILK